jgi:phosphohistidine phosphatase
VLKERLVQLFFLRHGPAEPKHEWSGDDEDRPLSTEGKLLVTQVASSPTLQSNPPELIISSPLERAKETAKIAAECLAAAERVIIDKRLAPGFSPKHLDKLLREHADCRVLMLVGHDPDMTELVRMLTGARRLSVRKGGLAQVELSDPKALKGRLVSLLVPTSTDPGSNTKDSEP